MTQCSYRCVHDKLCIEIFDAFLGTLSDTIVVLDAIEDTETLLVAAEVPVNPEAIVLLSGLITWVLHTRAKKMRTPCSRLMMSKARRALNAV